MTRQEIFHAIVRGLCEVTESDHVAVSLKQWHQTYGERGLYSLDFGSLGLDSLAKLELVDHLERTLGVRVSDNDLVGVSSFGYLVDLIEQKLAEKAASLAPSPA